jgi:formylglycine-generating enzyme required for sulfatase activity
MIRHDAAIQGARRSHLARERAVFRAMEESIRPSWRRTDEDDRSSTGHPVYGLQGWEDAPRAITQDRLDHPAQGVSWMDAQFFCNWLTLRERQEGRLKENQYYRLPTDGEWSLAAAAAPMEVLTGNYAGPEARTDRWPANLPTCDAGDAFPETSPAGSFPASATGLYDMGGNALEWVEDDSSGAPRTDENGARVPYTLRGGSWAVGKAEDLLVGHRFKARPNRRRIDFGFRCVLVTDSALSK